jgi:hypothetical protein
MPGNVGLVVDRTLITIVGTIGVGVSEQIFAQQVGCSSSTIKIIAADFNRDMQCIAMHALQDAMHCRMHAHNG